jgi:8-oxo-dGTP pyrophosphatase MutT (NUDIX family)
MRLNARDMFVCSSGNRVLLLLRRSAHNDNTWGLPGGNVDATDASLEATAVREAVEEMGTVPPFTIRGSVLTRYE